jgi:hypothetical protein
MDHYHPIIGIVLFILIFAMPILGQLHHRNFKKFQTRTGVSFAHIWLGRIIIPLGIINGGLGFALADNTSYGPIVYGIIAAIFYIVYLVAIVIGEKRRSRNRGMPPKYDEVLLENHSPPHSPPNSPPRHREYYGGGRK